MKKNWRYTEIAEWRTGYDLALSFHSSSLRLCDVISQSDLALAKISGFQAAEGFVSCNLFQKKMKIFHFSISSMYKFCY